MADTKMIADRGWLWGGRFTIRCGHITRSSFPASGALYRHRPPRQRFPLRHRLPHAPQLRFDF
jgi:hypothetical protein